ncbi:MAG: transposase family protein [Clostridia bacterium]|nr:transposase family protein [Clostridia bacterium]
MLHSDQGSQFASKEFTTFCKQNNVIQSMSRAGCLFDNAPMERYFNTFKSCFFNIYQFVSTHMLAILSLYNIGFLYLMI